MTAMSEADQRALTAEAVRTATLDQHEAIESLRAAGKCLEAEFPGAQEVWRDLLIEALT